MRTYFKPGCWNVICAVCGQKVKSDQIKKRWDGVFVCEQDWEPRHPLDFIRSINDDSSVPYISPEPTDTYIVVAYRASCQADVALTDGTKVGDFFPN